ncbi:hypothetical protein B0H21DRAFT_698307, partial [Amylocystis lapponica]
LTYSQRFCQSQSAAEIAEVLTGLKNRNILLDVADPEMVVVDNCCHVRSAIVKAFPDIKVVLDVWHFMMRYLICVMNGTRNPLRGAVAHDLSDAILKSKADKHNLATYWSQSEQEQRLIAVYDKWSSNGNVWTAAAAKTHTEQLAHVRKGCLARLRQDIRSDGSRIEGTHKGWNGLQRAQASGLSVMTALCHDYVLRRNIRVAFRDNTPDPNPFLLSTHGSHHIRLVDSVAKLWNQLLKKVKTKAPQGLRTLPELPIVSSGEVFGITNAHYTTSYHNLAEIKDEPDDELLDLSAQDEVVAQEILQDMNIDPRLLLQPLPSRSVSERTAQEHNLLTAPIPFVPHLDPPASPHVGPTAEPSIQITGQASVSPTSRTTAGSRRVAAALAGTQSAGRLSTPHVDAGPGLTQQAVLTPPPTPSSSSLKRKVGSDIFEADGISEFFAIQQSVVNPSSSSPKSSVSLPNLPPLAVTGGTPSQRLFSIATGIHPRSMTISSNDEFYLFMDMRSEKKWASFEMSPRKWVIAANDYNARLETFNRSRGSTTIRKTPRALMDKLGEIEPKILARIASGRYTSHRSNSEDFWKKHCAAVQLLRTNSNETKKRKTNTCTRCKTIMWPGPEGANINHRKGYCSDGVPQKPKKVEKTVGDKTEYIFEELPPWPQPHGIFAGGNQFSPGAFLDAVQQMYTQLVVEKDTGGELSMEFCAFAALLEKRLTVTPDGLALFELYQSFKYPLTHQDFIIELNGNKYLRVDSLQDESNFEPPDVVPSSSGSSGQ